MTNEHYFPICKAYERLMIKCITDGITVPDDFPRFVKLEYNDNNVIIRVINRLTREALSIDDISCKLAALIELYLDQQ